MIPSNHHQLFAVIVIHYNGNLHVWHQGLYLTSELTGKASISIPVLMITMEIRAPGQDTHCGLESSQQHIGGDAYPTGTDDFLTSVHIYYLIHVGL